MPSVQPAPGVVLDNTLVTGQTVPFANNTFTVTPDLGKQAGGNLFYSFGAFNLATGQTASFTGAPPRPVQDVFVRVTGGQASTIDGTLACTYPNASFFFMNSSGVTFTANAALNLQGSFAVTTADFVSFADGAHFPATGAMAGAALSSAAPAAFGFLPGGSPAGITINGGVVQVPAGKSLLAAAGSLTMNDGRLAAPGGPLAVATVAPGGQVSFDPATLSPSPVAAPGGAVAMTSASFITTDNPGAGSLSIQCGSLSMSGGSHISANTTGSGVGGDVNLTVTGDAALSGAGPVGIISAIQSQSAAAASGSAGNINFSSATLELTDGAQISSSTLGAGPAGVVKVAVSGQATLSGANQTFPSGVYSNSASTGAGGDAGGILLSAGSLQVLGGAEISSTTLGSGKGGSVAVNVSGPTFLSGVSASNGVSGVFANSYSSTAGGDAGSISLSAASLQALGGAEISSSTFGSGKGGSVAVNVSGQTILSGAAAAGVSGIFANSESPGASGGDAGSVSFTAGSLQVADGAEIASATLGAGNGGSVTVNVTGQVMLSGAGSNNFDSGIFAQSMSRGTGGDAGSVTLAAASLQVLDGAEIASSTFGTGRGGSVSVNVTGQAFLSGVHGNVGSGLYAQSNSSGAGGDAGSVALTAASLQVLGGAEIGSSTYGTGRGGNVMVNVSGPALLAGAAATAGDSGVYANSNALSGGNANSISLTAGSLRVLGGAEIASKTLGTGNGGDVMINVPGTILISGVDASFNGSGVYTESEPAGAGGAAGNVALSAGSLQLLGGGVVSSSTFGAGNGGDVTVSVARKTLLSGADAQFDISGIFATSESTGIGGNAGTVAFTSGALRVLGGATITSSTFGTGDSANVTVTVHGPAVLSGADANSDDSGIYATSESFGAGGNAGSVSFSATSLHVLAGAEVTASTFGRGNASDINISVAGPVVVAGTDAAGNRSGILAKSFGGAGHAGSVNLTAGSDRLLDGAEITSSATRSTAGSVTIVSRGALLVAGARIDAFSAGEGADVSLKSASQVLVQQSLVTGQSGGNGGQITLAAPTVTVGGSTINGLSNRNQPVVVKIGPSLVLIADTRILTDRPQFFPIFDLSGVVAPLRGGGGRAPDSRRMRARAGRPGRFEHFYRHRPRRHAPRRRRVGTGHAGRARSAGLDIEPATGSKARRTEWESGLALPAPPQWHRRLAVRLLPPTRIPPPAGASLNRAGEVRFPATALREPPRRHRSSRSSRTRRETDASTTRER